MYETLRPGPARPSAAEANDAIRHLVESRTEGEEWPAEAYEFLLSEWAAADHADVAGSLVR
ncbi:hypothetical protein [Streptomyces sp. NPDC012888]|uniref:hypothetical protein n=1 Tax=Streptomyces sp. NPDC012888 TaxID=3364855 RepID=UPI0036A38570